MSHMNDAQKYELATLCEEISRLEDILMGFNYRNLFGKTPSELAEMRNEREVIECDLLIANCALDKFRANLVK